MSGPDDKPPFKDFKISLPRRLAEQIEGICREFDQTPEDILTRAADQFLNERCPGNAVFLSAPVNSMMKGYYEQDTRIADLLDHGDFGLGTFNNLDGEMVMLDGKVYQLNADGRTYDVDPAVQTPFACVTFFAADTIEEIEGDFDYPLFQDLLDRLIPSVNMLYAIRIDGYFSQVKVWSVAKQENYQPLADVGNSQPSFEYHDIEGTMAGFYTPRFIKSLNMPGFHLHFLTADFKRGGHVHECRLKRAKISLQHIPRLTLNLPMTLDYLTANLPR